MELLTNNIIPIKFEIDDEDYLLIKDCKWYITKLGYPITNKPPRLLHRFLLSYDVKKYNVDHIDGNKLNNKRSNLRLATFSQNAANKKKQKIKSKSKYKGLSWCGATNKWRVCVEFEKKRYYLPRFENEIDAAKGYDELARKLQGNFALTNF